MAVNKEDVWADLRYALDELERPSSDVHIRLMADTEYLDERDKREFFNRLVVSFGMRSLVYSKAIARAEARIAHEAIEKGLKAILIDEGWTNTYVHDLHKLLDDVQRYSPESFREIERCFDSTIRYLAFVTGIQRSSNILDYFCENGNKKTYIANRYASIDGNNTIGGMIGLIYMEIIRALLWLLFDWTPIDIESRIEEAARRAVLAESGRDAAWDAEEWLDQGPVRPRLEVIKNLDNSRVLRAALRSCEKKSNDIRVQSWAERIKRNRIAAKQKERSERRR